MAQAVGTEPKPDRRRATLAGGALLLTTVFWGAMVPLTALLLQYFDPWFLAGARYIVALPFLWLFVALSREQVSWRGLSLPRVAALGAAMTMFSVLYTLGIASSHPVTASVILMCGPIVASIMARFLFGAPLDRTLLLALPVTIAGGVIVALGAPGRMQVGFGFGGGEFLLVFAQVCWTWYSMRAQQWLAHLGQIRLSALTTSAAGLWMIALYLLLWAVGVAAAPPVDVPLDMVAVLVLISLTGVAFAIVLWNFGASAIGVPQAALYLNLQPVVATLVAAALGSPPSLLQIAGGVIVMAGVLYVQLSRLRNASHAA
ncbi:MAG: DMT family transporter [Reyranellaceae bacterium]